MNLTLHVWRQLGPEDAGRFVRYEARDISPDSSFLEMLDVVNEALVHAGEEPIAFDHDCREGICGSCSMMIDGEAHGPQHGTTTCQLHMRHYHDGDEIWIEPWRAKAFPVIKDLVRRPERLRPDHRRGRIHLGEHGRRAGRERDPGAQESRRTPRWMPPRASAAGRAWRRARTARRRCSRRRRSRTSAVLPQGQPERYRRRDGDGGADGSRGVRRLHVAWGVPGSLPEGDLDRCDHADESRLSRGAGARRRHGVNAVRRGCETGCGHVGRTPLCIVHRASCSEA